MFVRPSHTELIVRHPETGRPLPAQGGDLPDLYALRRLRDGSVVRVDTPNHTSEAQRETEHKQRSRSARNSEAKGEAD